MTLSHKSTLKTLKVLVLLLCACEPVAALAGGITVSGTRFIFPADTSRTNVRVANTSETDNYLIQSWINTSAGQKSPDFVVTPPLYLSKPDSENMLSLIRIGGHFPADRETLLYLMVKAIPSVDESRDAGHTVIHVATVTQLKLFLRPRGLKPTPEEAPQRLMFSRSGNQLTVQNPTPYYLTLVKLTAGSRTLSDTMVPPMDYVKLPLPTGSGQVITLHAISDYGGISAPLRFSIRS